MAAEVVGRLKQRLGWRRIWRRMVAVLVVASGEVAVSAAAVQVAVGRLQPETARRVPTRSAGRWRAGTHPAQLLILLVS